MDGNRGMKGTGTGCGAIASIAMSLPLEDGLGKSGRVVMQVTVHPTLKARHDPDGLTARATRGHQIPRYPGVLPLHRPRVPLSILI